MSKEAMMKALAAIEEVLRISDRKHNAWDAAKAGLPMIRAALTAQPAEPVAWEDGYWQTECGQAWCFTEGGPAENGQNFCHHCGGKLIAAAQEGKP
jgi:acyl-coenzyme A synthetase/AMP-(fatty) acid ligase